MALHWHFTLKCFLFMVFFLDPQNRKFKDKSLVAFSLMFSEKTSEITLQTDLRFAYWHTPYRPIFLAAFQVYTEQHLQQFSHFVFFTESERTSVMPTLQNICSCLTFV